MKFLKFSSKKFLVYFGLGLTFFLSFTWLTLELTTSKIPLLRFHGIIGVETSAPQVKPFEMDYPQPELETFLNLFIKAQLLVYK